MKLMLISLAFLSAVLYGIFTLSAKKTANEYNALTDAEVVEPAPLIPTVPDVFAKPFLNAPEITSAEKIQSIAKSKNIDVELLRWYFALPPIQHDQTNITNSTNDEMYAVFHKKMRENPAAFIQLATAGFDNPYLLMVLDEIPSKHVELLLPFIGKYPNLAETAYQRNLHISHPTTFENALYEWSGDPGSVPVALLLPAIKNNAKGAYGIIEEAAIHGIDRNRILTELEHSEQFDVSALAETIWQSYENEQTIYGQVEAAYIASRYLGERDAIHELARLYETSQVEDRQFLARNISGLAKNFDIRQLAQYAERIEYDSEQKVWYLPE